MSKINYTTRKDVKAWPFFFFLLIPSNSDSLDKQDFHNTCLVPLYARFFRLLPYSDHCSAPSRFKKYELLQFFGKPENIASYPTIVDICVQANIVQQCQQLPDSAVFESTQSTTFAPYLKHVTPCINYQFSPFFNQQIIIRQGMPKNSDYGM